MPVCIEKIDGDFNRPTNQPTGRILINLSFRKLKIEKKAKICNYVSRLRICNIEMNTLASCLKLYPEFRNSSLIKLSKSRLNNNEVVRCMRARATSYKIQKGQPQVSNTFLPTPMMCTVHSA